MKRLAAILVLIIISSRLWSQEKYLPTNGELPKEGTYTRIGPLEIWMANIPGAGIKILNPEDGKEFYAYLEFGAYYKAYKIYKRGGGLLVNSIVTSDGKFIKSGTDKFFKTTYNWSANSSLSKTELEIKGCKEFYLCVPEIYFSETNFDSKGTMTSYLVMYFSYGNKTN